MTDHKLQESCQVYLDRFFPRVGGEHLFETVLVVLLSACRLDLFESIEYRLRTKRIFTRRFIALPLQL